MIKKDFILFFILVFTNSYLYSQIGITNAAPNNNPTYLINNVLIGGGVSASNITFSGNTQQIGYFSSGASIGMPEGIVMSSGHVTNADLGGNPAAGNTPANGVQCNASPNTICNDLLTVANSVPPLVGQWFSVSDINDMCVLEFDFVPESDTVTFNYSFGSEEYLTWVNSSYNDVFGFFISGPGINGPYSSPAGFPNGSQNIAYVPNSNPPLPITVSSVHPGYNGQYYNTGNSTISYNGYTDVFTAMVVVNPCETYHIRLAIADGTDDWLDSGVFLEANSFTSTSLGVGAYGVSIAADTLSVQCNATIDLEAIINGPYNILWNTGSSSTIINVGAGIYSFVATSVNGSCVLFSDTITIVEQSIFNVDTTVTNASCYGVSNGDIDLTVSGGTFPYTYLWTNAVSGFTSTTQDLNAIPAGTYTCLITDDNGCSPPIITIVISEPPTVTVTTFTSDVVCNADNDGSISISVSGGFSPYTVNWTSQNGYTGNTFYLNALYADVYTANIYDNNGCGPIVEIINITEPPPISAYGLSSNISCYGNIDGVVDITSSGNNLVFNWTGLNGFVSSTEDILNLEAGTYTLSVSDINNCPGPIQSYYIYEPSDIIVTPISTNISCYSYNDGSINLTIQGGTGAITTSWSGPNGYSLISEDINTLSAGIYTYTVTDIMGCSPSAPIVPIVISEPATVNISSLIVDESCYGLADGQFDVTINGAGTFSYSWNGPNGFTSSLEDIFQLSAGTYNLTITDLNGCSQTISENINIGNIIQLDTFIQNISCNGVNDGNIVVLPQNANLPTYQWVGPNGFTSTLNIITNLSVGVYNLIVNDNSNCPTIFNFDISEPNAMSLSYTVFDESCIGQDDGQIELFVSGGNPGYNYVWNNGQNTAVNSALSTGYYVVNVVDNNNCIVSDTIYVNTSLFDTSRIVNNVSCFGGSDGSVDLDIVGGNYPFTYNWNNGATTQDLVNLQAGVYTVSITDASNCVITKDVIITQSPLLTVTSNIAPILCYGDNTGTVSLQMTGGTSPFQIDWGSTDTTSMLSGYHIYTITDYKMCKFTDSVEILQADSMEILFVKTDVQCFGELTGEIDLQIQSSTGTPPYTYQWSGPNNFSSATEDISNLEIGLYSVVVQDANMCTQQLDIVIDEPTPISQITNINTSNYSGYNVRCKGENSAWIELNISGGYPPYNYLWNNGDVNDSVFNLYVGNYSVTITDGLGCTEDLSININEPPTIITGNVIATTDFNGYNIRCFGNNDGAIDAGATDGIPPYTYLWNNELTTSSISDLIAGYYEVFIYDKNMCLFIDSVTLTEPTELFFDLTYVSDTCGRSVGEAEVVTIGGVPPYFINWSNGGVNSVESNFPQGMYEVLVADNNFCEKSQTFVIENLESPIADFTTYPDHKRFVDQQNEPFYFVDNSQIFWTTVKDWQWDFGDLSSGTDSVSSHSYSDLGTYRVTLTITTQSNCIDTISKTVLVDAYNLYIPNSFKPDGKIIENTIFKSYGEGIKTFKMKIFSRWGELLFLSEDVNVGWDGIKEGKDEICPNGVYTYSVVVENIYGEIHTHYGQFNLLR